MEYRSAAAEAERLTKGARNKDYGHPLDDYTKTGWLWAPILTEMWLRRGLESLGVELDAEALLAVFGPVPSEAAILCMGQVKVSRELNRPGRDNAVDGCGYWECLNMARHEGDRRNATDAHG